MEILILLAFFMFMMYITSSSKSVVKSAPCTKGHKWVYKNENTDEEYMVCSECKYLPGMEMREEK